MTDLLAQGASAGGSDAEVVLFWIFAVIGVGAGIAVITMRNVVHGALMLVLNLLAVAVLFLVLQSAFLAIVQVIVYAGAIVVLFLFVIMLLGVDRDDLLESSRSNRVVAGVGGLLLAGLLLVAFIGPYTSSASRCGGDPAPGGDAVACAGMDGALAAQQQGSVGVVADALFNRYTFPFEAAALLLVVATLGALVLGRRHDPQPGEDPAYASSGPPLRSDEEHTPGGGGSRHSESGRSADRGGER